MKFWTFILLPFAILAIGCHTYTQAPGAIGYVVDGQTGKELHGARITRPFLLGGTMAHPGLPAEGLAEASASSGQLGRFDLPPATETQIAFMFRRNPENISGTFFISADGYMTNEVHGVATSHSSWRVDLGRVALKKE